MLNTGAPSAPNPGGPPVGMPPSNGPPPMMGGPPMMMRGGPPMGHGGPMGPRGPMMSGQFMKNLESVQSDPINRFGII